MELVEETVLKLGFILKGNRRRKINGYLIFSKKQEDILKKELDENIQFQFPWGKRWARMYVIKNEGEMTDELKDWAVATMVKFYNVLKPKLDDYFRSA